MTVRKIRIEQSFSNMNRHIRGKWFIVREISFDDKPFTKVDKVQYLHKDLTWHPYCGAENFWDTMIDAENALLRLGLNIKSMPDFITEKEFEI